VILDRSKVYKVLDDHGIPTSPHYVVNHLDPVQAAAFEEHEDYIVINGQQLSKPFVEKPVCALSTQMAGRKCSNNMLICLAGRWREPQCEHLLRLC
jgi:hypothetical protein